MKMEVVPKISIIVPVYRVEQYLNRCIDSLLCQSMTEIEIILVDDGSPDRCGDICDEYAKKDTRVKVIHQNNQGLSVARNVGIEAANSEYIMFVDSDDWVDSDFCKIPYVISQEHKADMVIFRFRVIGGDNNQLLYEQKPGEISRDNAIHFIYHGGGIAVWNKLYHKKLLRKNRFIPGKYYEDQPFTIDAVCLAEHIYFTDQVLYNYQRREESITNHKTQKSQTDFLEMIRYSAIKLEELGYEEEAKQRYLCFCWEYRTRRGMKGAYADECNRELIAVRKPPEWFGCKVKIMLRLLRVSPLLFDAICILFKRRFYENEE